MIAREVSKRMDELELELADLEVSLVAVQQQYEELALELNALLNLQRRLRTYQLPNPLSLNWAAVCRARGWPLPARGGHFAVKRQDPRLHALLHLCVFESFCSLEHVTYQV